MSDPSEIDVDGDAGLGLAFGKPTTIVIVRYELFLIQRPSFF